jgi:formate hydrogenlyase subunit 4
VTDAALLGQARMTLGLIATVLLLLFGDWQLGEIGNYLHAHSWTFLRAPLLVALALWFACYAVAFRLCIRNLPAGR